LAGSRVSNGFCQKNHNDYDSYGESIRQCVFRELDKNPLLTASALHSILKLDDKTSLQVLANYKTQWRHNYRNERGLKCSLHGWRGWAYLPSGVGAGIRSDAVDVGWLRSRARNRWLLWKDRLGRLQWFETGRVNVYVRKPANLGRAYQLICNAFSFTGLITDFKVLEQVLSSVRFKGAHYVFPVGQRLPKLTIDLFQKSNGIVIKVGDDTHPESLEVLATYPDWAERNERLLEQLNDVLKQTVGAQDARSNAEDLRRAEDYVS
jgi:hypothetical protein